MQWYYSKNGTQLGPVEVEELRAKIASGEVTASDLVWREGMTDWLPSAKATELAAVAAPGMAIPQVSRDATLHSPYHPPAAGPAPVSHSPNFPNYLWQSIVVTIFCCWPFGIPAIVYAAKVEGLRARGDISGAMSAAASAKTWCLVSAFTWLGFALLALLVAVGSSLANQ